MSNIKLPQEIIDNPHLLSYQRYFNKFMETVTEWFRCEAKSCRKWPRTEIGFKNDSAFILNNVFYRQARIYFDYNVILDNNGRRRFLATFLREAGYPENVIPKNIIEAMIPHCHWEQLAEKPFEMIEELRYSGIIDDIIKKNRHLFENEEGISALTDLLQKLAYMKLNYEGKDDPDLKHKYSEILQLEGSLAKKKKKLKIEYRIQFSDTLEMKDCTPVNIGLFFNINSDGVLLPNGNISPLYPQFSSSDENNSIDLSQMKMSIGNNLIKSKEKQGFFIRMKKYTPNLNIFLISGEKSNQDFTNIECLKRQDILIFDAKGHELNGDSIDVASNASIWLLPISPDAKSILELIPDVKKTILDKALFYPFFRLNKQQTVDGQFQLNDLIINFTDTPVNLDFPEKSTFTSRFTQNVYTVSEACNKRIKIDIDDMEITITSSYKNLNTDNIDKFKGRSIPLPKIPGNYRLSINGSDDNKLKDCKITIIPDIEINENESDVSISCIRSDAYSARLISDKLELSNSEEDEVCIYHPKESKDINAVLNIQKKDVNLIFIDLPIVIDCKPDVVAYINSNLTEIKNDGCYNLCDLSRSGFIKVKNKSFTDIKTINKYKLELNPTPLRHQFSHKYIYNIPSSMHWEPVITIMNNIPMNQATFKVFKNDEHEPCFSFVIINKSVCKLISDVKEQKIYPDPDKLETDKIDKYSYRLFNICSLWENPLEICKETLDYSDIEPGIWMIYLTKDNQIVSEGIFLKNSPEDIDLSRLDDFQKALIDLELNSYESFKSVYDGLLSAGYFTIKEKAKKLVRIYENIIENAVPDDFFIYALFPEKFPILPLWWVLATDPNNPEIHFTSEQDEQNTLAQEYIFSDHNRFCWELISLSFLDKVENIPVFYLLNNPVMMGISDNLWWIKLAWFIRKNKYDENMMEMFVDILRRQQEYKYLENFKEAYIWDPYIDDFDFESTSDFYPRFFPSGILASIKETINSFRDLNFDWIKESDKAYFNKEGFKNLVEKFINNIYEYTDDSPSNKIYLAQPFLNIMVQATNYLKGVTEINEEELYCAMIAYDTVCHQLELYDVKLFDQRTVRLIGLKAFKNSVPRHFKAWYSQWMILLIKKWFGFDLLDPEKSIATIIGKPKNKASIKVIVNGDICQHEGTQDISDIDLNPSKSLFEFDKEFSKYQINITPIEKNLKNVKLFNVISKTQTWHPIVNYLSKNNIEEWEMEIFNQYEPSQILFKCTLLQKEKNYDIQ